MIKKRELYLPILDLLGNGEVINNNEFRQRVMELYSILPNYLLEMKTSSGESLLWNQARWAKSFLKNAGLLQMPHKGEIQITARGQKCLEKGEITPEDIQFEKIKKKDDESSLPSRSALYIPILKNLRNKEVMLGNEFYQMIRDEYSNLSDDILNVKSKNGESLMLFDRAKRAKTDLKNSKMIQIVKNRVQITDKGLQTLNKEKFSSKDLKNDSDYKAFMEALKNKKGLKKNSSEDYNPLTVNPSNISEEGIRYMLSNNICMQVTYRFIKKE